MADSELGELRRPPRIIEHRIERLSRHRSAGLAGGSTDAAIPVDGTDDALLGGGDSGGGEESAVPEWYHDTTTLTSTSAATWPLTFYPVPNSEVIRLNGLVLEVGVDYTIADNVVTFLDLTSLRKGIGAATWTLSANYAYTETADGLPFLTTWTLNGDAYLSSGAVELHTSTSNRNGSMMSPVAIASGWSTIEVTLVINPSASGDGWQVILWDAATHTAGSELDMTGTRYSGMYNDTWVTHNHTEFRSNDGTTTISVFDDPIFMNGGLGDREVRVVWTKTGGSTAHVDVNLAGSLVKSSPSDVWVPATVLIGVWGYNGLLSSILHTVKDIDVMVT